MESCSKGCCLPTRDPGTRAPAGTPTHTHARAQCIAGARYTPWVQARCMWYRGDGFGMHGIEASVNPQRSRTLTPDPLVCTTRKPSVSGDIGPIPSELISAIARKPLKALRVLARAHASRASHASRVARRTRRTPAHTRPPAPVRPPARVARRTRGGCEKLYAPVNWITQ